MDLTKAFESHREVTPGYLGGRIGVSRKLETWALASIRVPLGMSSPGQDGHRGWAAGSCSIHTHSAQRLTYSHRQEPGSASSQGGEDPAKSTSCFRPSISSQGSRQYSTARLVRAGRRGDRVSGQLTLPSWGLHTAGRTLKMSEELEISRGSALCMTLGI